MTATSTESLLYPSSNGQRNGILDIAHSSYFYRDGPPIPSRELGSSTQFTDQNSLSATKDQRPFVCTTTPSASPKNRRRLRRYISRLLPCFIGPDATTSLRNSCKTTSSITLTANKNNENNVSETVEPGTPAEDEPILSAFTLAKLAEDVEHQIIEQLTEKYINEELQVAEQLEQHKLRRDSSLNILLEDSLSSSQNAKFAQTKSKKPLSATRSTQSDSSRPTFEGCELEFGVEERKLAKSVCTTPKKRLGENYNNALRRPSAVEFLQFRELFHYQNSCSSLFGDSRASIVSPEAALLALENDCFNGNGPTISLNDLTTFGQVLRHSLFQVSVDTMAITALPLDCWLKERLKNWVQLSGHEGTIVPASNHTLWKKQPSSNLTEALAYTEIMNDVALRGLTPKFYKEITHKNESFIEIQDLLAQFTNTETRAIMDIKIGTRTFLESEVSNTTIRNDLYKKMMDIAPDEPNEEEHRDQAITKLRYMQFRERESSTATLGFRIEAAQMPGGRLQKCFKKIRTKEKVINTFEQFFGPRSGHIREQLALRFRAIRDGVERSEFFRTHEVIGSSILVVYDEEKAGAWMIDFAKSSRIPEGSSVDHRTPWELGNHEDGYLTGLDHLIEILVTSDR